MMDSPWFQTVAATLRRLTWPSLLAVALGYALFGSAMWQVTHDRLHQLGTMFSRRCDDWLDYQDRRAFAAGQEQLKGALERRRQVSREIEVLRQQRHQMAEQLQRNTARADSIRQVSMSPATRPMDELHAVTRREAELRREQALLANLQEADRQLDILTRALAQLDQQSLDAWHLFERRALELNARGAWRAAGISYEEGRRLLDHLPQQPDRDVAADSPPSRHGK